MTGRRAWILLLLPLCWANDAPAQDKPVRTIAFEDAEVFCHILHHRKQPLIAVASFDELTQDSSDAILIVFGNPHSDNAMRALEHIPGFLRKGGAVLLATDGRVTRNRGLPIQISGRKIERSESFGGSDQCPWLAQITGGDHKTWDASHPIFQLVLKGIATNCPSSVEMVGKDASLRPLLAFPTDGRHAKVDYIIGSPRDAPPLGRALYLAGHGVFMNGMLLQKQADNFRFAINVVAWLAEAPDGKQRSKALLIVDGAIVPDFDMKLTPPAPPIPMPPRTIINRLLRDLQEEGRIHDAFYGSIDQPSMIAYALSMLVGALLIYGAKKLLDGRYQVDPAAPRMVGSSAFAALAPHAVQAQQIATLLHANMRREARRLAAAWLHQEFGAESQRWTEATKVQLRVQRYFWTLGATQRQADLVVRMARIAKGTNVSQREFLQVVRALQALSQTARAGRITLLIDGKTVRKAP